MLDPVSALSLAGNIFQVIDFAGKIVSESRQIYKSSVGASVGNAELRTVTQDLHTLSASLERPLHRANEGCLGDDGDIQQLVAASKAIAKELLNALEDLSVKGPNKKWQSFRQALRSVRKEKQIKDIERRLESYRSQITARLVATLRYEAGRIGVFFSLPSGS